MARKPGKRTGQKGRIDKDPALALGIEGGLSGFDFTHTSIFGDSESMEFVVSYNVKAPVVFAFVPDIRLPTE